MSDKTGYDSRNTTKIKKTAFFILQCTRLALSFNKTGGASAMQNQKTASFILQCTRLALSFNNIGGASTLQNQKTAFFILQCTRLALSLHRQRKFQEKEL